MSVLHGDSPALHAAGAYLDLDRRMTVLVDIDRSEYLSVAEGGGLLAGDWFGQSLPHPGPDIDTGSRSEIFRVQLLLVWSVWCERIIRIFEEALDSHIYTL